MPSQYFETVVLREAAIEEKWQALTEQDRHAIAFRFFEIALRPDLRRWIRPLPAQMRQNGRRLHRFVMDMGFGCFVFAMPVGGCAIALIDFAVDMPLLNAYQLPQAWHN
jgi:hypothetical protein